MIKLMITAPSGVRELTFTGASVLVGAAPECGIRISGDVPHHAQIEKKDGVWHLTSITPGHHTRLNGRDAVDASPLRLGDEILIGDTAILVTDADTPAAAPPAPQPESVPAPPPERTTPDHQTRRTRRATERRSQRTVAPERKPSAVGLALREGLVAIGQEARAALRALGRLLRATPSVIVVTARKLPACGRAIVQAVKNPKRTAAAALAGLLWTARKTPAFLRAVARGAVLAPGKITAAVEKLPERLKTSRRARLTAIGVAAVIAGFLAHILFFSSTIEEEDSQPEADSVERAEEVLAQLRAKVEKAGEISEELVLEVRTAARFYGPRLSSEESPANPFDPIVASLLQKRAQAFAQRYEDARNSVAQNLESRSYAKGMKALAAFRSFVDSSYDEAVRDLVSQIDAKLDQDFLATMKVGRRIEEARRYGDAMAFYQAHAHRFRDTRYFIRINGKFDDLTAVSKAESETAEAAVVAVREAERVRLAAESRNTPEALPAGLVGKLITMVTAGRFAGRAYPFDGATGTPVHASAIVLTVKTAGENQDLAWAAISPALLFKMGTDVLRGDDLLLAAEFGYRNGLAPESDKLLFQLANGGTPQPAIDQALAQSRHLLAPPEGGYAYDPKYGWEDLAQRENRRLLAVALDLVKELPKGENPKRREAIFAKIIEIYDGPLTFPATREAIRTQARTVLSAWKRRNVESIARRAASVGSGQVRPLKIELNKRRKEALDVIYDERIYIPEKDPRWHRDDDANNGHARVDELVGQVRKIWETPATMVAPDAAVRRDLDEIREANEKYLAPLGEEVDTDRDLNEVMEVCVNAGRGKLSVRDYCLTREEKEIWDWNRRVDRYNEALRVDGVGEEEKAHAAVLNEYREMMGRRKLFLDALLCKATKKHSAVCSAAGRIWHVGSDGDPQSRADAEGFKGAVGENVAIGYASPVDIWWRGWYKASDHHRNALLAAYNCMGYGYSGNVGTENFSYINPPGGF